MEAHATFGDWDGYCRTVSASTPRCAPPWCTDWSTTEPQGRPYPGGVTTMASPRTAIAVNAAPSWLVWIFRVNLIVQVGIVVTGGLVRLTGSAPRLPDLARSVDGSWSPPHGRKRPGTSTSDSATAL